MKLSLKLKTIEEPDYDDYDDEIDQEDTEIVVACMEGEMNVVFDIYNLGLSRWWQFGSSKQYKIKVIGVDDVFGGGS